MLQNCEGQKYCRMLQGEHSAMFMFMGAQKNCLIEGVVLSTQNICFS